MTTKKITDFKHWWETNKKVLESEEHTKREIAFAAWLECTKTKQLPCKKIPYCSRRLRPEVICDSHCDYYIPYIFTK